MEASRAPDLSVLMNYEYESDPDGDTALAYVLALTGSHKKVLEVGAGSGVITKHLVHRMGCDVVAVEINPASVEKLRTHVDRVYRLDLNDPGWTTDVEAEGPFDTIIAADVLEHLYDPWRVLSAMRSLLNETGAIVLSLPHAAHCGIGSCLFDGDFHYGEWGLLDKTHIRFFGLHNIHALHASAGLAIADARFVIRHPTETEFADRWARLPADMQRALLANTHGYVYQVVTTARPVEQVAAPVNLLAMSARRRQSLVDTPFVEQRLAPPSPPPTFFQKMKAMLLRQQPLS